MSNRCSFRSFRKGKLRVEERYFHCLQEMEIPKGILAKDTLILIPDGRFLRTYLDFLEEFLGNYTPNHEIHGLCLIFLESASESMDHRHCSPVLISNNFVVEPSAINERKRLVTLWDEYKIDSRHDAVSVYSFADLSLRGEEDDEFVTFDYENMAVEDRSRCAFLRAAQLVPGMAGHSDSKIVLLSKDEQLLESSSNLEAESNLPWKIMSCESFISFFVSNCVDMNDSEKDLISQHWTKIRQKCEEDFAERITFNQQQLNSQDIDKYGHSEYHPERKLQEGILRKNFFQGVLNVTDANSKEAYCAVQTSNGDKIKYYLNETHGHFNRAIHGDNVVIEPLPKDLWEQPIGKRRLVNSTSHEEGDKAEMILGSKTSVPSARVIGLSHQRTQRRKYVATLLTPRATTVLQRHDNYVLVAPMDAKMPYIRISTQISRDKLENKRILVEIDDWTVGSKYPSGHFVEVIGEVGDLDTEVACLLREHSIDLSPFSANALACLPRISEGGWRIDEKEIMRRRDLRKNYIFSVDPIGCQDIDDAMHTRVLDNGDIEVGVHIADVTHFLKHRSSLDKEAAKRATTVYLVDRRFDMLPPLLSSDLCSLHGNIDRLAVSVIWVYSSDLETVKSVWYGRTVIHNIQAMTYEQAHKILHNQLPEGSGYVRPPPLTAGYPVNEKQKGDLKGSLALLTRLARKLRSRRESNGAVDLSGGSNGSELKFVLDESGNPTKVTPKKDLEIHHTIAELMIMANNFVAETIHKSFPETALLRIHQSANIDKFDELQSMLEASGSSFDGKSNKALATSLKDAKAKSCHGSEQHDLFQSLATRAMSEAQYVCNGTFNGDGSLSHYGLGIGLYTHFTSPIRRYADVIVHRLLLESKVDKKNNPCNAITTRSLQSKISLIPESNALSILNTNTNSKVGTQKSVNAIDPLIGGIDTLFWRASYHEGNDCSDERNRLIQPSSSRRPLYQPIELGKICDNLNNQNRKAKLSSMRCQRLFLSLYFRQHEEVTDAIVIGLRQNGLIVYIPKFDMKGPVFLTDRNGNVQIDPEVIGQSTSSGNLPSSHSPTAKGCRIFPGGRCILHDEDEISQSSLELQLSADIVNPSFRKLDLIAVRLSCDISNTVARIPMPHLHLISTKKLPHNSHIAEKTAVKLGIRSSHRDDSQLHPPLQSNLLTTKSNHLPEQSIYRLMSSFLASPTLENVSIRSIAREPSLTPTNRLQSIKGRLFINGFKAEKIQDEKLKFDRTCGASGTSLVEQAVSGDYSASKQIEKQATARIQRIAAEKHKANRSKANRRK